ncbi:class I SAM-dependent methyltransferase [Pseudodesulfovibrio sp.]|uniref:class I SAM-dependent methyltransferase n=1 Tax=unclassified Pseudodesulfovibrio TaxID=2661612 RepID=UPI003AFF8F8E
MKKYNIKNIDDQAYSQAYATLERSFLFRIGFALKYRYILPVLKTVSRDKSVVDIGCAHGLFLNYLARNGFSRLFGMDLKNELYDHVASAPQIAFIEQSILHPDVQKGGPFDVLHISGVLHHLPPDKLCSVPKIMANILTRDGKLFIYEPNRFSRIGSLFYDRILPLALPLLHRLSAQELQIQHAFSLKMPSFMAEFKEYFDILSYSDKWFYYSIIAKKR